jgi:hypothetical protein
VRGAVDDGGACAGGAEVEAEVGADE